jgi:hypothetical protein
MSHPMRIAFVLIALALGAVAPGAGAATPLEPYALAPITGPLAFYGQGLGDGWPGLAGLGSRDVYC